jgi:hypothetical protein
MANQNIRTPRFYTDLINYHKARGADIGAIAGADSDFIGLPNNTSVHDLLDLRPLNQVSFLTTRERDKHVLFKFNFSSSTYKQTYVAILNHNLDSSNGRFKIFAGDEDDDHVAVDAGNADLADVNWSNAGTTEIVNADTIAASDSNKSVTVTPASDGSTIVTFNERNLRYWGIQFEGDTQWDISNEFKIGGIMIGEHFDMPQSPDLQLTRRIHYDKVDIQESLGGQRFANATSFGRLGSSNSKSPFTLGTFGQRPYGGRIIYDMNFSFLKASDLLPSETTIYQTADDSVISDAWNMTDGPHRPFIFSIDNTSTGANAESEHLFARFNQDSLDMQQVAQDVYNTSLSITEEF